MCDICAGCVIEQLMKVLVNFDNVILWYHVSWHLVCFLQGAESALASKDMHSRVSYSQIINSSE